MLQNLINRVPVSFLIRLLLRNENLALRMRVYSNINGSIVNGTTSSLPLLHDRDRASHEHRVSLRHLTPRPRRIPPVVRCSRASDYGWRGDNTEFQGTPLLSPPPFLPPGTSSTTSVYATEGIYVPKQRSACGHTMRIDRDVIVRVLPTHTPATQQWRG